MTEVISRRDAGSASGPVSGYRSDPAPTPDVPRTELQVLQRVLFPPADDLDIVPLYVETNPERGAALAAAEIARGAGAKDTSATDVPAAVVETQSSVRFNPGARDMGDLGRRRTAELAANSRISFATYFNAFPAGYWQRWTIVEEVVLRLRVIGDCTVAVYRSTAKGHSHPVRSAQAAGLADVELRLPLDQFMDGGWYWFDIVTGSQDVLLEWAEWVTPAQRMRSGRFSIGITTFNRPEFCVRGLAVLGGAAEVLQHVDRVYVVDQGSDRASDHPDFADAVKAFDGRVEVIEQANLGGSGGFSRAMDETLRAGESDYVLLLDDDVVTEPESLLRAITFAHFTRRPMLVGGHMFSLYDRTVLHALGESVEPHTWWWGAAPHTKQSHDFGRRNLRNTAWLHRRVDADYNGWWMCLIPTAAIRELGLSLPVFIKWDDAEYGLRAKAAGFPTVSLPGVAVWHIPWQDKNDALDWQAYFHTRNRLVTALLHSPYPRGGALVAECFEHQVRHLLSMQYSTARLRLTAIEDVLAGPNHLHRELPGKLAELQALRKQYPDARTQQDLDLFPAPRSRKPPWRGSGPQPPRNPAMLVLKAALSAARQLRPVAASDAQQPQAVVANQNAEWWLLSTLEGALVSSPDGANTAWYRRDPRLFSSLLRESLTLHARLLHEWPELANRYRLDARYVTSPDRWRRTFEAAPPS